VTPRKAKPLQGEKGEKALSSAEKKLARGKGKGTYDYPGLTARRGRRENT
jgi:hypothetical protein